MAIKWDQSLSVGVKEIDNQHKLFIETLNKLNTAIYQSKPKNILNDIFESLYNYATIHFDAEEKYFKKFKYEGSKEHVEEHHSFSRKLEEYRNRPRKDHVALSLDLIDYLENWLVSHLNEMDKRYTKCFNDHGLF